MKQFACYLHVHVHVEFVYVYDCEHTEHEVECKQVVT